MNEITVKPLVDILSTQLSKQVVMSGDSYVYMDTKEVVTQSEIDIAKETQQLDLVSRELLVSVKVAQSYLDSTDFYMTIDKYASLSEERQLELTTLREEAREVIRSYDVEAEEV